MNIANYNSTSKENQHQLLRFKQPLRLKVSVTHSAFLLIFRNYTGEIIASRISLLPAVLIGKREQSALFALACAKRMLDSEAMAGYRIGLLHCPALQPKDFGPNNKGRVAA